MMNESNGTALRRTTGALFLVGALAFATAASILSATFDWPDILREPADVVLTRFGAGGASLIWIWFATTWTCQLLGIGWSVTLSIIIIIRSRVLPRWLGVTGLIVSVLYLLNQGDIVATAHPGFPVFDLAGLIGSTGWGLWVAALGAMLLVRPKSRST